MDFSFTLPAQNIDLILDASSIGTRPWPRIMVFGTSVHTYFNRDYREATGIAAHCWEGSLDLMAVDPGKKNPHWFTGVLPKAISKSRVSIDPYSMVGISKYGAVGSDYEAYGSIDAKVWVSADLFASIWKTCEAASTSMQRALTFSLTVYQDDYEVLGEKLKSDNSIRMDGHGEFRCGAHSLVSYQAMMETKEKKAREAEKAAKE